MSWMIWNTRSMCCGQIIYLLLELNIECTPLPLLHHTGFVNKDRSVKQSVAFSLTRPTPDQSREAPKANELPAQSFCHVWHILCVDKRLFFILQGESGRTVPDSPVRGIGSSQQELGASDFSVTSIFVKVQLLHSLQAVVHVRGRSGKTNNWASHYCR